MHVFSTSFNDKSKACGLNEAKYLFMCYFTCQAQKITITIKITISGSFYEIPNSW